MKWLLWPFAVLYDLAVRVRIFFYTSGISKREEFDIPIIGVGNLSVGGTGKTPMTEYLVELLSSNGYCTAVLSRGYRRLTKGFKLVTPNGTASDFGDEPLQIKRKFPYTAVAVCEKRVQGVKVLIQLENPDVILLDDSFQHLPLKCSFYVLLSAVHRPFFKDYLLPFGSLREPKKSIQRASALVFTKLTQAQLEDQDFKNNLVRKSNFPQESIFFASISYNNLVSAGKKERSLVKFNSNESILFFSGIAGSQTVLRDLKSKGIEKITTIDFPDHHVFSSTDIEKINQTFNELQAPKRLLTTEKDWTRLLGTEYEEQLILLGLQYLEIGTAFDGLEKSKFDRLILDHVRAFKAKR